MPAFIKNIVPLMLFVGNAVAIEIENPITPVSPSTQSIVGGIAQELKARNIDAGFVTSFLKNYPTDRLVLTTTWMKDTGAWNKCSDGWQIKDLLNLLKDYQEDKLSPATTWMKDSGAWNKCSDGWQIKNLLNLLKNYPEERLALATTWMKDSGAVDKCSDGGQIKNLLNLLKDYPEDKLGLTITWMKDSGAWDKCSDGGQIKSLLNLLKDYPEDKLGLTTTWMKDTGAVDKCSDGGQIKDLLEYLKDYPEDKLGLTTTWMKDTGAWDKCSSGWQVESLLELLKDYPEDKLALTTTWMKDSGAWDKCSDGGQIKGLLQYLKDYPEERLAPTTTWMKDSGAWDKCSDGNEIRVILAVLKNMDLVLIQDTSKSLPIDHNYEDFYVMMHKFFPQDERFKKALYSLLEDQSNREWIIESIQWIFGEESPITQEFIYLVIGLENNSATSAFAVHKEMLEKRAQVATHPTHDYDGVHLNLDIIKQPPSLANPVHIPLNRWDGLFEELQGETERIRQLQELLVLNNDEWSNIKSLQHNQFLRNLLDPTDSLAVQGYVGPLSRKFREILRDILDLTNDNPGAFLQLLINIQTCPTGKENGILHYWNTKNNSCYLDEGVLKTQGFVDEITAFFVEELRRSRYNMPSLMLRREFPNCNLQHSLHYLNGVIGSEIGLSHAEDMPTFDIHSSCVDQGLRDISKQEFLDLFYTHYTPKYVIEKVLGMLNDGSVKISNSTELTLRILNEFLSGDYFVLNADGTGQMNLDLVEVDANGAPVKFKAEAAKRILVTLGILTKKRKNLKRRRIIPILSKIEEKVS